MLVVSTTDRTAEMQTYVDAVVDQAINPYTPHTDEWSRFEEYVENVVQTAAEWAQGKTDLDPRTCWATAADIISGATDQD